MGARDSVQQNAQWLRSDQVALRAWGVFPFAGCFCKVNTKSLEPEISRLYISILFFLVEKLLKNHLRTLKHSQQTITAWRRYTLAILSRLLSILSQSLLDHTLITCLYLPAFLPASRRILMRCPHHHLDHPALNTDG